MVTRIRVVQYIILNVNLKGSHLQLKRAWQSRHTWLLLHLFFVVLGYIPLIFSIMHFLNNSYSFTGAIKVFKGSIVCILCSFFPSSWWWPRRIFTFKQHGKQFVNGIWVEKTHENRSNSFQSFLWNCGNWKHTVRLG